VSWLLRVSVVVALAAVIACVPACSKKNDGRMKIGIVTNCIAEFWKICEAGASKAAEKHNVDLHFREPEKNFDPATQTPIIESWEKQGFDGIAVSVINPEGQTETLARIAKKIPLITMDNDAEKSGRLCYIGIDNYEGGKAVGRLVKKALPNGGTVAIFIGDMKSANGRSRTQGVLDELAGQKDAQGTDAAHPTKPDLKGKMFGKYLLVDGAVKEDGGQTNAQSVAGGVLARVKGLPDLCMVGLYAYNPPAILADARSKGMAGQIKIVGFDEDWETLKGIASGEIMATVVQDPFEYGYKSVEALATKNYNVAPIPYRVVTKDGGPDETVNGVVVKNLKEADFTAKLKADLDSAPKR
jgi:ribose transport system substrate-binding protein